MKRDVAHHLVMYTTFFENFPESIVIDSVKSFGQIDKNIKRFKPFNVVLFYIFLSNLTRRDDHIYYHDQNRSHTESQDKFDQQDWIQDG